MPYIIPTNKTLIAGTPLVEELKLTTGTDCYAGLLVAKGSDDEYGVVGTAILPPVGFISYEHTHPEYQPATYATAFAANAIAGIISGPVVVKGKLALKCKATKGDLLANWAGGQLVPVAYIGGGLAVKVPVSNTATVKTDTITLPAGVMVKDAVVQVTTAVAAATIDIGLTTTDADGFLDGESMATAGIVPHIMVNATAANLTTGVLLVDTSDIQSDGAGVFTSIKVQPGYLMAAAEALCYTTNDKAIAGFMYIVLDHPAFQVVGKAAADADASSAACDIQVQVMI